MCVYIHIYNNLIYTSSNDLKIFSLYFSTAKMHYYYFFRRYSKFVTTVIILFLILLGGGGSTVKASTKLRRNETILAIQAFGDSFLDTGNNNHLISITKCDFPPYGRDFLGGIPTGRFTNGKVISDLFGISSFLHIYIYIYI